jgi:AcrR family transcriptional regulator
MRAAAQHFFANAEFSEVSMEAIAADAGLTPAAIYNHFPSKERLFMATAVHITRVNLKAIEATLDHHSEWKDMLAAILRLFADNTTGWLRYPLVTTAVQLKMLQNRERYAEMLQLRREYMVQFERIVGAAISQGDLPAHLPRAIAAQLLMGFLFNGMGTVMSHRHSDDEIAAIVDTTAILLGVGVRSARL